MADNHAEEKGPVRSRRNRSRKERVQKKLGKLFNQLGEEQVQREEAEVGSREWRERLRAAEERVCELEHDLAKAKEESELKGLEVHALRSLRQQTPLLPRESVPEDRVCRVKPRVVAPSAGGASRRMNARAHGNVFGRLGPAPLPLIPAEEWDEEFGIRRSPPLPAFTAEREAERAQRPPIDWGAFRT